jgi:hypothetical protein
MAALKKIHVLATPRSGATAYSLQLSKQYDIPFINEPFKFANYYKKVTIGEFSFGGRIPGSAKSYVCHHITSQYLMHYNPLKIPKEHELIFIDRRDKWAQMLSYFAGILLHKKYNGWHNVSYDTESITIGERYIQRLMQEWTLFDVFTSKFPKNKILYYEDLKFDENSPIKKNQGFNNIIFKNQKKIYDYYKIYMKNRPDLPIVQYWSGTTQGN